MKESNLIISLLTIMFVGLKLASIIDWPWWWVLSPIWIVFLLRVVVRSFITIQENKIQQIKKERDSKRPKSAFERKMQEMKEQAKNK